MKNIWEINSLKEYKELNKDVFKNHKAHYTDLKNNDCIILFKEDGTNYYEIMFTYINGVITISGDLGYAIFTWHNPKNHILAHLSFTSIGYIMSKCVAKDVSDTDGFNSDLAQQELKDILEEEDVDLESHYIDDIPYFESYLERDSWADEKANKILEDAYETGIYNVGNYLGERPYLWWTALHKALEILDNKGVFR